MSTKVKEALFELIQSMSKSEKRYFKLMASRHTIGEENNYVVLFDFIEKMSVYSEELIEKQFKGEAFLNRFSITKKRLYDHILQSLDAFHSANSLDAQLHMQIHSAEILYNKALYDQSRRLLRSAEKLAMKNEKYHFLQQINKLNKKLLENQGYSESSQQLIDDIVLKDEECANHIQRSNKLWKIKSNLFNRLHTKGVARSVEDKLAFKEMIRELESPGVDAGFEERYLYHHTQSVYFFAIQDQISCVFWLNKNLELFENDPIQLRSQLTTYLSILTNAIYTNESIGQRNEAGRLLQVLRKLPEEHASSISEDMEVKLFASVNSVELGVHMKRGDLIQALKLVPTIENGLKTYEGKITSIRRAFLSFKVATLYLGVCQYSEALKWVNRIFNDPDLDPSEDLLAFTYIIDLLIHLEMRHEKLLPYALKNTQRFLRSRNKVHGFEKAFLQFISKRIKAQDKFRENELWDELLKELRSLNGDGLDKAAMEYFDFISWAESKVNDKSFEQLLREKSVNHLQKAS
jgi:hypothetical protein